MAGSSVQRDHLALLIWLADPPKTLICELLPRRPVISDEVDGWRPGAHPICMAPLLLKLRALLLIEVALEGQQRQVLPLQLFVLLPLFFLLLPLSQLFQFSQLSQFFQFS